MPNQSPFFSVITSFFNSEKYLYKYISKLQDQTFLNWECILIDDYSEDNGYEKVSQLIKNDERIRVYKNKLKKERQDQQTSSCSAHIHRQDIGRRIPFHAKGHVKDTAELTRPVRTNFARVRW